MSSGSVVDSAGAARILQAASRVSVVTHIRPDADAIGSATALARALRTLGTEVNILIGEPHPFPENLRCIPGSGEIQLGGELDDGRLIVTVDCASLDRTGMLADQIAVAPQVLVIDHHVSNTGFGHHNLIQQAESTTTLLRDVFEHLGVELDYELAYSLYAGLVTDTGSFKWGTPRMHTLAAELLEYGLDPRKISMELMDSMSATDLHHLGKIVSGVQIRRAHGYQLMILIADSANLKHMSQPAVETVIDYSRVLAGTDIGVVLKETHPGDWSVSLRSSDIDVSLVAKRLGGGGHSPAAGYSAMGSVQEVVDKLVDALRCT
ncbi:DHH family phosphoesterase [Corynebacterium cystitidis]|uniref:Phosphoesterase RecJ domain-containing protein n=1 Tax=Corynebacterium cystitidis DSM 20524 TaxID=1121357 RepID=A0A1H9P269_9CORY|nr:bifunctional oligoribonuclease/PAP phosphatase NrnA [Corynebacterium cystitidis]WJY82644.1 Bifunctional oligoribonuclease and PAP phosphatase NrnA [Corynebacterium cystitidis DSM 20524]SER42278.1 phosphoesterase RecJ domain-containing protein [Corynebacterium cystitidis DSM 20524]SNV72368.1 exopolyphosphatase [Corynebacterium cystitidis]